MRRINWVLGLVTLAAVVFPFVAEPIGGLIGRAYAAPPVDPVYTVAKQVLALASDGHSSGVLLYRTYSDGSRTLTLSVSDLEPGQYKVAFNGVAFDVIAVPEYGDFKFEWLSVSQQREARLLPKSFPKEFVAGDVFAVGDLTGEYAPRDAR